MAGRRRTQRSARVTVAATLVAVAACCVVLALATSSAIDAAAILAVAAGAVAVRLVYTEGLRSRRESSRSRADQALAFAQALSVLRAEHSELVAGLTVRLRDRERCMRDLDARARAVEELAQVTQSRAERATAQADEARARLSEVLDAVLASPAVTTAPVEQVEPVEPRGADADLYSRELPTVVDMLAWEERTSGSRGDRARRRA
jgi:hypothetical protein